MGWLDSLHGSVVGLDTAPLIYFIENNPKYFPILLPFFEAIHNGSIQVVTSSLTLTEVMVLPYRTGNEALAAEYARILLHSKNLTVMPVSEAVAEEAARIRAIHGYKTPDAIQIATAKLGSATAFLTNDRDIAGLPGLQAIQVDDLIG